MNEAERYLLYILELLGGSSNEWSRWILILYNIYVQSR